jgi:hypothetical protein
MKPYPLTYLTAGFTALLMTPAFAIEAPEDTTPPPAEALAEAAPEKNPAPQEASAFLGVVTADVSEPLVEHLGLKAGEGVLVRALMPDGPAAKAGLGVYDIITHIAGKPVGSPLELSNRVASHKPGETVQLDLIHKGKPTKLGVALGSKPADIASIQPGPLDQLNLDGIPEDFADRVRETIEGNLGQMDMKLGPQGMEFPPHMDQAMRDMKERMQRAMEELDAPKALGDSKLQFNQESTVRLMDDQGSVEIKSRNGGKEVTVRDKENKVLWSGPWDTDQDKAAAPDDVRQRVDRLNLDTTFKGNGLRFHFRGGAPDDE